MIGVTISYSGDSRLIRNGANEMGQKEVFLRHQSLGAKTPEKWRDLAGRKWEVSETPVKSRSASVSEPKSQAQGGDLRFQKVLIERLEPLTVDLTLNGEVVEHVGEREEEFSASVHDLVCGCEVE